MVSPLQCPHTEEVLDTTREKLNTCLFHHQVVYKIQHAIFLICIQAREYSFPSMVTGFCVLTNTPLVFSHDLVSCSYKQLRFSLVDLK